MSRTSARARRAWSPGSCAPSRHRRSSCDCPRPRCRSGACSSTAAFGAIFTMGIGTSSWRVGANTGSTSNWPRYFGSSLYSIDGCTNGAMRAWSFAVSSFAKTRYALLAAPRCDQRRTNVPRVGQVLDESFTRRRLHRLDTDLGAPASLSSALLEALGADGERRIVHVPDGQAREASAASGSRG